MSFLESPRFPTNINYGVVGGPTYKTNLIEKNSGAESANVVWPQGRHEYDLVYAVKDQATIEQLLQFFHATKGRSLGFRFKDFAEYKSCSVENIPKFLDQNVQGVIDGTNRIFQLIKTYTQGDITTTRTISKPVPNTVFVGLAGFPATGVTINYNTGQLTLAENQTGLLTGITLTNPCVMTVDNELDLNDTIYLSGIVGTIQLNEHRYRITARTDTTLTLDVDSTFFSPYVSGGVFHTLPQTGEVVTAGFEFDVPVRFTNDDLKISLDNFKTRTVQNLSLIEIRV